MPGASLILKASARLAPTRALASRTHVHIQRRTLLKLADKKYTAHAVASGAGRNGRVVLEGEGSEKAPLDLKLSTPPQLGGKGDGNNPEQLFAMGYASCFLGALQLVAGKQGKKKLVENAKIQADVHIGTPEGMEGFAVNVDLKVEGVQDNELIQAAHETCPYSRIMKHGAVVNVSKA